ncbi:GAF domain-containing protein [Candidatus Oscillochloris fontis]|uniref:GAF domain-containing protein n=1 Tax=Candidatus Oscillochloris fontis TaxID=2496868 RepID=UPI001EE927AA|nr:GAF domain-containing protein [Candidatus Oscillochloris fontis]
MPRLSSRRTQVLLDHQRQQNMLRRERERDQRVLSALYNISLACRDRPTLRVILETIYHELAAVFEFDAFYIALCDAIPEIFSAALLVDEGQVEYLEGLEYGFLTGAVVRDRTPFLYRDLVTERSTPIVTFGNHEKQSRSWLGVPLMLGDEAVGVVSIQSYQVGRYIQDTLDLLQSIANVIAVAVENVRLMEMHGQLSRALHEQISARTEELAALSQIAGAAVSHHSLNTILDEVLGVALNLFGFDAGNVRLLDDTQNYLVLYAHRGFSQHYAEVTIRSPLATSPLRNVVLEQKPQVVERSWRDRFDLGQFPVHIFPPFEAALSLPLSISSQVLGTLSLFGLNPRLINEHTLSLAQAVANQIAIVVENTRLLDVRERQIRELRALSSVSRAASTAQDLRSLLRQVHDALKEFIPLDRFSMLIYDPERQIVSDAISIDAHQTYDYWVNQPPPPRSLSAWIIRSGLPLRFENLPAQIAALEDVNRIVDSGAPQSLSWMGVPMLDRERRGIGLISVQSYHANIFTPRDESLLYSVAAQVALHVQNVRLLTQRARQIAELEAIGQIGKLVTASYNLDQILNEVRRVILDLTHASIFYLIICDPKTQIISHTIFIEKGDEILLGMQGMRILPNTMTDWIMSHREPLLYQDLDTQQDDIVRRGIILHSIGADERVRSWAGVPLLARDGEMMGVLAVQDYRPYRYDLGTLDFLAQVGSHISLGVQKMRLFESVEAQVVENARLAAEAQAHAKAAEEQASRIGLVQRITSLLSTRRNLNDVLDIASRELVQIFGADHTGTMLFRPDGSGYLAAEYPSTGILGMILDLRNNPVAEMILATRRPLLIRNIESDPHAVASRQQWRMMGIRSLVIIPLISRDHVFGSISLDSYDVSLNFGDDEMDLLLTVSTSIAAAVENAQLFAAEQEQRRTADTLREMARVLSSSFNPDEVLQLILGELHKLIAYDTVSVMLLDGNHLRIVASRGLPEADPHTISLPMDGSAAGEVVRRREPVVRLPGRDDLPWTKLSASQEIRAWLGVPLIARGNMLGVLNIDLRSEGANFDERDIEVARTFANHAAVALENAQRYQESIGRIEQELEIARHIQSNLFPSQLPSIHGLTLAARCLPARETGGDFYDVIDMGVRAGIIVGDVSGKSLPAAMLMAAARSTSRSEARNHETPWVVLTETNYWLVDDVPDNAFVALSYALVDPRQQRLILSSAGQLSPLLRRADSLTTFIHSPYAVRMYG